jgi:hypothetical protein
MEPYIHENSTCLKDRLQRRHQRVRVLELDDPALPDIL